MIVRFGRFLKTLHSNLSGASPPRADEVGHGMVVAGGIGGHAAGENASHLAITGFLDLVLGHPRLDLPDA